ncbi:MAG: DUF2293 domain-containing protein [Bacteroidales bacterium]
MPLILTPGPSNTLLDEQGNVHTPPPSWQFLPAGDAGITRKVTAKGEYWRVQVKMGRRLISKGVWAPATTIAEAKRDMEGVRQTDAYQKKMAAGKARREKKQATYEMDFLDAVLQYLNFHPCYAQEAKRMAELICAHATPVGSGTVARTTRIPIGERAEKAVIAWMRHQTTAYDDMPIARIKGERRKVRRMLAERSVRLLEQYRQGNEIPPFCPLRKVLEAF